MSTDVAPARRITRIKSLYGKIARFVTRTAPSRMHRRSVTIPLRRGPTVGQPNRSWP